IRNLVPYITNLNPAEKAVIKNLSYIEVFFSENVNGVDADDLLANGIPSISVNQITPSHYIFTFLYDLTGEINMQWRDGHNISDTDGNLFRGGSWTYYVNPDVQFGVIISEVMAGNKSTIRDEDGDYSDWIEIANLSDQPVDLNGWTLTDNIIKPLKWCFPQIILNPGDYMLIFASGKNRTNSEAYLHTNFSLDKDGEFVGLFDLNGDYIDGLNFPPLQDNQSYGKMEENTNIVGFCLKPTPGNKNSLIGCDYSSDTIFSEASKTFTEPFYLRISTESTNATIYYSTDGYSPCPGSTIWSEPLLITTDKVWIINSYAVEPNKLPSKIKTQVYIPLEYDMTNFSSTLPIVVIEINDNYSFTWNEYQNIHTTIFDTGSIFANGNPAELITKAKIKIHGTTSTNQPKKSFAVKWIDNDENELNLKTLGMPADSDWILYAPNNYDTPLIHNAFMYDLSNQIGRYAPRYRFVELFIHNNAKLSYSNYHGIYLLVEKIKRGSNRVNIEKLEPEFDTEPKITGGYIFKKDWLDKPENVFNAGGQTLIFVYPNGKEMSKPERTKQKEFLTSYLDNFYNALYSDNFRDPTNGYNAYIDVDSWIDFHLLNTLSFNVDALWLSTYFHKPRNGKIHCGPIWDFDRSMDSRDDPRDD
ncbi:MAG TPA: CotH kinase family protein, partial [Verrucomicrobiota bacterium]|nr:CotH kinase family protein [Verrucomicrobiota bacterium]